jgi:hypothetical protein
MRSRIPVAAAIALAGQLAAAQAFDGLTLYNTIGSRTTYLKSNSGQTVNSWTSGNVCYMAYLLPDSTVWRMEVYPGSVMRGGPYGGLMTHYNWDNDPIESFLWSDSNHQQHHDINVMPNGHVLSVAWARKTRDEGLAMGRLGLTSDIWPDEVIEWDPEGDSVAWEWSFWDHLVQDVDPAKPNYGVVAEHPELLDINQGTIQQGGDWMHANTVDYDEQRDEVMVTSHSLHEFYVIDHSTTTEQARGHTGGRHGKGGDFLYRWGNPQVYDRGTAADQVLFVAHGGNWVRAGLPGAGNILVLNNGDRPGTAGDSSVVVEITPPLDSADHYYIHPDSAFGPRATTWQYSNGRSFYSQHLGGAYRLPNGNTLATLGVGGVLQEITPGRTVAWTYNTGSQVARASKYARDLTGVGAAGSASVVRNLRCSSPVRRGGRATIGYELDRPGRVCLRLFDATGRAAAVLVDGDRAAGPNEEIFAAPVRTAPAGVYFVQLTVRTPGGPHDAGRLKLVLAD